MNPENVKYKEAVLNGTPMPEPEEETIEEKEAFVEWINAPENKQEKEIFLNKFYKNKQKCSCCDTTENLEIVLKDKTLLKNEEDLL